MALAKSAARAGLRVDQWGGQRHRHLTLQLLWEEYSAEHGAAAYQRIAFCQIYRDWEKRLKRSKWKC